MEPVGCPETSVINFLRSLEFYGLCLLHKFRREVHENCALTGYYVVSKGNLLPTFRGKLYVPSSGFKNPFLL